MENETPRILAIDDNRDNLTALRAVMADVFPGAALFTALNGRDGIELALTRDPDVILLDIVMPGMDGFEVCRKLKDDERLRHIPVVFLTALKTDRENRVKALEAGAEAFLSKPLDEVELAAQIRAMVKIKAASAARLREKERLAGLVEERTRELEEELAMRRRTEETLRQNRETAERLAEEMAIIAGIGRVIGSTLDIEEVYERFAAEAKKLIPFDQVSVNLKNPDEETVTITYVSGIDIPERRAGAIIPVAGTVSDMVMRTRKALRLSPANTEEMARCCPDVNNAISVRMGIHSNMVVPLTSWGGVIGTLQFRAKKPNAYTDQDLRLAERIGMQIAGAIANAQLFKELRKTENFLRESEERFRLAYQTSPDAININRLDDGLFVDINEGFTHLTGYTREDVAGKTAPEIGIWFNPADRQELIRGLKEKGYYENLEADFQRKDGSTTTALMSARVMNLQGIPHIISITRDISERIRLQAERKELEERLQRAEKMEALGTLAGGVAHDLNNVLGIVVGYSEMLIGEMDESSPLKSDLQKIMDGGTRAAAIVQDLLTLARRGVQTRKTVNLNQTIMDCRKTPEFEKLLSLAPPVQLRLNLGVDLLNIMGSPVHLSKTLLNLASNAVEAMPNGGTLTIATGNQYVDRPIRGYDQICNGDYVVLSVSDTGQGIQANDMTRIFEPFYTKKVMGRSGTGLGLAVVWGTVKDHRGYIDVESKEGEGSTFTLYFPVTREDLPEDQAISISASEYMGQGESILVVDDVAGQRELAVRILTALNYRAASVCSGEEAVAYVINNKTELVVLDMIMDPGMDGLDTYMKILEIYPNQKAIIVSGFSETDRVRKVQHLGAGDYVRKPYAMEKLGLAIRRELAR